VDLGGGGGGAHRHNSPRIEIEMSTAGELMGSTEHEFWGRLRRIQKFNPQEKSGEDMGITQIPSGVRSLQGSDPTNRTRPNRGYLGGKRTITNNFTC
jgi:hypothetical protein